MIPHITKGDRASGLLTYLVGPGKRNEHSDPHLVAGDSSMMAWHDDNELSRDAGLRIARHLDRPKRHFGTESPEGHVWHCSLSLSASEGALEDEQWRQIAERFVDEMGFGESDGAPCRWVALRHGLSTNGNDHIHIALNTVREDGTRASTWRDMPRSQEVCRRLEADFGLVELDSTQQRSSVGYHPAEAEAEARRKVRGRFERARSEGTETRTWEQVPAAEKSGWIGGAAAQAAPRLRMERAVRSAAGQSQDEAEFVRRIRQQGVLVRPRYAEGTQDVIVGYSVAARPTDGERPIWFGGNRLARDLTIPRLREAWPDTPESAAEAAAEWNAAKRGRRPAAPGREVSGPGDAVWTQVRDEVGQLRARLARMDVNDRGQWEQVARETSAAFAAWSARVEPVPGPLADAARTLGVSASTKRRVQPPGSVKRSPAGQVAMVLSTVVAGKDGAIADAAMLRLLLGLARDLHNAKQAQSAAWDARRLEQMARAELQAVTAALPMDARGVRAVVPGEVGGGETREKPRGPVPQRPVPQRPGPPIPGQLPPPGVRTQPGVER